MRIRMPYVLPVCMVLALAVSSRAQDRISWVTDLKVARQMAEQQQRLVLLHFWTETCTPCQKLERYVFNQPELIRALSTGYIPVKINAQQSPDLASYYKVTGVPTDIIVDPSGKELFRSTSPQDPNKYIAMLDGVKANASLGIVASAESLASSLPASANAWNAGSTTSNAGPAMGATPQEAPRSSYLENPYANSLSGGTPPSSTAQYEPRYGSSYAPQAESGAPSARMSDEGSRWQSVPGGPTAANPGGAAPYPPSYSRVSPPLPAMGTERPGTAGRSDSAWEQRPSGAVNPPANGSYSAGMDAANQWQAGAAPSGRPWESTPPASPQNSAGVTPPANPGYAPRMNAGPPVASPGPQNVALDGFCPVSLVEQGAWSKGDPRWGAVHRGRVYLFSSAQGQQRFLTDPERFSPVLEGNDPVRFAETGQLVAGKREHGVYYGDRIVLFADEDALQRFGSRPDYYVAFMQQGGARSAMGVRQP